MDLDLRRNKKIDYEDEKGGFFDIVDVFEAFKESDTLLSELYVDIQPLEQENFYSLNVLHNDEANDKITYMTPSDEGYGLSMGVLDKNKLNDSIVGMSSLRELKKLKAEPEKTIFEERKNLQFLIEGLPKTEKYQILETELVKKELDNTRYVLEKYATEMISSGKEQKVILSIVNTMNKPIFHRGN